MPEEVMIIAVFAIIFGTALTGLIFWGIYSLIKTKLDQKKTSTDINPQFFKALSEFKKNTERRINQLEAIVSDLEEDRYRVNEDEIKSQIEIEDEEIRSSTDKEKGGNLRNMLNE